VAVLLQQYNTQIHKSHTDTLITQNNTTKNKQIKKQLTKLANEYSVEKGEEIKRSLIQALEAC
jgi:acetolactate synthase small subunit